MRTRLLAILLVAAALGAQAPAPWKARPVAELLAEARAARPPQLAPGRRPADLVDLAALDPTLRLDIAYARPDNFLGVPVYTQARAFLQRPAAEALVRVNRALAAEGLALRLHDAYRPWWVTKVFWEATDPKDHAYVADPAKGSIHNRGCAVDLDLVRLADGSALPMPSAYDEMSERSHADYAGGPAEARRNRDRLRAAMAAEGFTVLKEEWWHFDHALSREYGVMNVPFEALGAPDPRVQAAQQALLVTTDGWDTARGRMQRFERAGTGFRAAGPAVPVWIGKKGLAWRTDAGAPAPPAPGPLKREGDGRSPAGVMTFGDLWGYADRAPEGVKLPYRQATDCDRCVDDPDHADYNRLVRLPDPKAPVTFKSAEELRLPTEHYRYMVILHYNDQAPIKGAGSCIFLHVAPPPGGGTAGCTALPVEGLLDLLRWLDPAKAPVLIQVPEADFEAARTAWQLPEGLRPQP